jgi:hypothetical protein
VAKGKILIAGILWVKSLFSDGYKSETVPALRADSRSFGCASRDEAARAALRMTLF